MQTRELNGKEMMALLKPLDRTGSPDADAALARMAAKIGYRENALATIARRPEAAKAVLSLIEEAIVRPGALLSLAVKQERPRCIPAE